MRLEEQLKKLTIHLLIYHQAMYFFMKLLLTLDMDKYPLVTQIIFEKYDRLTILTGSVSSLN